MLSRPAPKCALRIRLVIGVLAASQILGCAADGPPVEQTPSASNVKPVTALSLEATPAPRQLPPIMIDPTREQIDAACTPIVLEGLCAYVPNTKNFEHFYGADATLQSHRGFSRVRASSAVSEKQIERFDGKMVRVQGLLEPTYEVSIERYAGMQRPISVSEVKADGTITESKYFSMGGLVRVARIEEIAVMIDPTQGQIDAARTPVVIEGTVQLFAPGPNPQNVDAMIRRDGDWGDQVRASQAVPRETVQDFAGKSVRIQGTRDPTYLVSADQNNPAERRPGRAAAPKHVLRGGVVNVVHIEEIAAK